MTEHLVRIYGTIHLVALLDSRHIVYILLIKRLPHNPPPHPLDNPPITPSPATPSPTTPPQKTADLTTHPSTDAKYPMGAYLEFSNVKLKTINNEGRIYRIRWAMHNT